MTTKRRTKRKRAESKMETHLSAGQKKKKKERAETRLSLSHTRQLRNISSFSGCDGLLCEHVSAFISAAFFFPPVRDGFSFFIRCSFMFRFLQNHTV